LPRDDGVSGLDPACVAALEVHPTDDTREAENVPATGEVVDRRSRVAGISWPFSMHVCPVAEARLQSALVEAPERNTTLRDSETDVASFKRLRNDGR
jgi:hypothetical protein